MFCRLALAALLLFPAAIVAQAQDDAPVTTLKLSTRIVVLDVVVTDKKGKLVTTGLTRDDFQIVEDKTPQTIRSYEAPETHAMPAGVQVASAADLKKIGDAPVTLLVLDELNTKFEDMSYSRASMVKYLQAQPAVLKQPTVLLLASNTRFQQLHDYTQNRDELIEQIRRHMPEIPTKFNAGRGGAAAVERMVQTLSSLEQIAQASAGTPGRKNVVWVGAGFPSAGLVGLDDKTAATIVAAVKQCTDQLLAARVTMYTINPTPNSTVVLEVETPDDLALSEDTAGTDPFQGTVQFSTLGPATGGTAFQSRNDISNEIAEGIAQGNNYYTLSYAPTNRSDDAAAFRKVVILMKDKSLHATTRNGYYPPTAATQNIAATEAPKQARNQLVMELSNAVNSAITYNGLEVTAAKSGGDYTITVKGNGMEWRALNATTEQTEATVLAAWYDAKGKLLGHSGKELTATRAAGVPNDATPAVFTLAVALTGNPARLRLIVRDAANARIGTTDLQKP